VLWTNPVGIRMLGYGAVMLLLGAFWMSKLTKIRV
jgi:Flp pilus assembly protein TadB